MAISNFAQALATFVLNIQCYTLTNAFSSYFQRIGVSPETRYK